MLRMLSALVLALLVLTDCVALAGPVVLEPVQLDRSEALDRQVQESEVRRLEAERRKLELETEEIERRLNAQWWQGHKLTEYALAIVITSAVLFGWARIYLQPILRREAELNSLVEQRNEARNELLDVQYQRVVQQQAELMDDRDRLIQEAANLQRETEMLEKNRSALELAVAGLKVAVDQAVLNKGDFFSILNARDPINKLKLYGWDMWSNNYFGKIGYYLEIKHENVLSGEILIVTRIFEINMLRKDRGVGWRSYIEDINARGMPVLALDYTYFSLLVDQDAAVGGMFYTKGSEDIPFYAPLKLWSDEMAAFFRK